MYLYYYFGYGKPKLEARDLQGLSSPWSRVKQYNTRMRNIKKRRQITARSYIKRNGTIIKILNRKEEYKI